MCCMIFLVLALAAPLAQAGDYVAAPGSTLVARGSFDGEPMEARFTRFTPRIRFDPAQPGQARFDVAIELASVASGTDDGDELLRGAAFFAVGKHPQARFTASRVRALGGSRFVAEGELALRGLRRPATLSFRWTPGARPVLEGEAVLRRLDFGVGAGEWADPETIGNEVKVATRLVLAPAPAARPTR
jgi:polyisoprenoid-binding protein YceI